MNRSALPLTALCLVAAAWLNLSAAPAVSPAPAVPSVATQDSAVVGADGKRLAKQPDVSDLGFLAGLWTGSDGKSDWESCYTTGAGGQLVGASKELRDGKVIMMDFEHFYVLDGTVRMRPYPFGKRSVEFELTRFDAENQRAIFVNLEHDFPKSFIYHRTG